MQGSSEMNSKSNIRVVELSTMWSMLSRIIIIVLVSRHDIYMKYRYIFSDNRDSLISLGSPRYAWARTFIHSFLSHGSIIIVCPEDSVQP